MLSFLFRVKFNAYNETQSKENVMPSISNLASMIIVPVAYAIWKAGQKLETMIEQNAQ